LLNNEMVIAVPQSKIKIYVNFIIFLHTLFNKKGLIKCIKC